MANPYHDELGRFTSGPGAGRLGEGMTVKTSGGNRYRVVGQAHDSMATDAVIVRSLFSNNVEGSATYILKADSLTPIKISGRGAGGLSSKDIRAAVKANKGGVKDFQGQYKGYERIKSLPKGAKPLTIKGYND